jgi:hypothetical protein
MTGNAQRKRLLPAVQPTGLNQQCQAPNVISMRVCDPDRVKIRKNRTKIQQLGTARLPGIQKHSTPANLEKNAGLKAPRGHVAGAGPKKSHRWHVVELLEDLSAVDKLRQAKKLQPSPPKLKSDRCGSSVNMPSGYCFFAW